MNEAEVRRCVQDYVPVVVSVRGHVWIRVRFVVQDRVRFVVQDRARVCVWGRVQGSVRRQNERI